MVAIFLDFSFTSSINLSALSFSYFSRWNILISLWFLKSSIRYVLSTPALNICSVATFPILFPKVLAASEAKGIIISANKESFQFWKNITVSKPIKVKPSLNKLRTAVLIKFVIWPTSLVKVDINFPVCLLSINLVSADIRLFNISHCKFFLTSSETPIIKTFATYKDKPFVANAIIIIIGINNISVWSFSINIFFIAGSRR